MCVAIIKPVSKNIPNEDILKNCFEKNKDGSGFSYFRNGELFIHKGFLSFCDFKKSLKEADIKEDEPAFFHFRKASFGGLDIRRTQPFPLTNSIPFMMKKSISGCRFAFMHNGTINYTDSEYQKYNEDNSYEKSISDTMLFGINVWNNIVNPYEKKRYCIESMVADYILKGDSQLKKQIDISVGDNKFAFLNDEGKVVLFGRGWKVRNGIIYSNDKYLEKTVNESKVPKQCSFCFVKTTNYEYGEDIIYCLDCEKKRLNQNPNSFCCKECKTSFLTEKESALLKGICQECESKNHTCSFCSSTFISESSLSSVSQFETGETKKFCQECLRKAFRKI